jgi:hypothetical protein
MWSVEYRVPGRNDEAEHIRVVRSQEEALALSAHFMLRGQAITCIRRGCSIVMDTEQIRGALNTLDNNRDAWKV